MSSTKAAAATEAELIAMIRKRIEINSGNGPQGCVIPQVRDAAGFDARRSLDAVSMRFWPSHGLLIEGYECKSSRSDLLRELKDLSKAEQFARSLDRFWLVTGAPGIAKLEELPEAWGLLVASGGKLKQLRAAAPLHDLPGKRPADRPLPPGFGRGILVGLLRNGTAAQRATPEAVTAAVASALEQAEARHKRTVDSWRESRNDLRSAIETFKRETGIDVTGQHTYPHDPEGIARTVRMVLRGEVELDRLEQRLARLVEEAGELAAAGRRIVERGTARE